MDWQERVLFHLLEIAVCRYGEKQPEDPRLRIVCLGRMNEIHPTFCDDTAIATPDQYIGKALKHSAAQVRPMSFLDNLRPINSKVVSPNSVMPEIVQQLLLDPGSYL